ncbi:cysteine-rich CWC family protein [Variovorax dokdonensis]|uniref:Cysteine-rich CWC family protein n=1 Tax=Variovorax dokdonensis TaxID=344883 RepID=A0ABT7NAA4_9BURK|nr:cysteine-rich CWC family protein [Variovorax dokdonensis]MDM0044871.1 cysteine-rich CWC family protein [Variovorax dokdonensis]
MPAAADVDPTRCPLCGGDNRCAVEVERATGQAQPPCWCMSTPIDAALIEQVARQAPQASGKACICARCALAGALVPATSELASQEQPS